MKKGGLWSALFRVGYCPVVGAGGPLELLPLVPAAGASVELVPPLAVEDAPMLPLEPEFLRAW